MSNKKRSHHYLPQFYVGSFTNKFGEVSVFNKKKAEINKQGKYGTFHLPYFYTVNFDKYEKRSPEEAGRILKAMGIERVDTSLVKEYPDALEDLLGESENNASLIIPKLINGKDIDSWERIELSTFISFMYSRTPSFRQKSETIEKKKFDDKIKKICSSKDNLKKIYEKMREDGYDKNIDINEIYSFVKEKRYEILVPKEMNIQNMLYVATKIDRILYNKTWFITEAHPDSSFVTTDIPVLIAHSDTTLDTLRFDTPGVKIIFPLSQRAILMMQNTEYGAVIFRNRLDKSKTRYLNKIIAANSGNYIIARDEKLIKSLLSI